MSSSGTTPSGRSSPKAQTWRIGNSSAADLHGGFGCAAPMRRSDDRLGAGARAAPPPCPAGATAAAAAPRSCRRAARRAARSRSRPCWAAAAPTTVSVCKAERAQPGGERRDGAVGLRVSQRARRAVGEARAVRRVDQRQRIGDAHAGAAEQVVERRRRCAVGCRRGSWRASSVPPGFRQIAEQRGALRDARFASSAPPIAPADNKAGPRRSRTAARGRARAWRRRSRSRAAALSRPRSWRRSPSI